MRIYDPARFAGRDNELGNELADKEGRRHSAHNTLKGVSRMLPEISMEPMSFAKLRLIKSLMLLNLRSQLQ